MTASAYYRIEQVDRDGKTTKYIDNLRDKPITLPLATKYIDLARDIEPEAYTAGDLDWRAVKIEPSPLEVAEAWLVDGRELTGGEQLAACLELAAARLREVGPTVPVSMDITILPNLYTSSSEAEMAASIDALAEALGTYAAPRELSGGLWHHTTTGRDDSVRSVRILASITPPAPVVEKPVVEQVDARPVQADGIGDAPAGEPVAEPVTITVPVATREQIDAVVRGWYANRLPVAGGFAFDDKTRTLTLAMREIEHVTAWADHLGVETGGVFHRHDGSASTQLSRYFHDAKHADLPGWTITARWDIKVTDARADEICAVLNGSGQKREAEVAAASSIAEVASFDDVELVAVLFDGQRISWVTADQRWSVTR